MAVKIQNPINLSQSQLGDSVDFQGSADDGVVRVELFAEQYLLANVPVVNNNWSISYRFNRMGKRQIIAKGFNATNTQVTTDTISILILGTSVSNPTNNINTPLLGIDVSIHNPPINWQAVKNAKILFAFAKATEGFTLKDSTFSQNWSGMKAAGIIRGAYHFFNPKRTGEQQAENYLQVIKNVRESGDLPPVVDVEPWPPKVGEAWKELNLNERINRIKAWLTKVEEATGEKPIIYTSPSFWREYMNDSQVFTDYPLWLAHFTGAKQPDVPANNWGAKGHTFWQYTESGTVTGVKGPVDINRFNGSFDKLVALANGALVA